MKFKKKTFALYFTSLEIIIRFFSYILKKKKNLGKVPKYYLCSKIYLYFFRSESKICLMWLIVRCTGKKPETTSALKLIGILSCEKKKKRLNMLDYIATLKFSICVKNKFRWVLRTFVTSKYPPSCPNIILSPSHIILKVVFVTLIFGADATMQCQCYNAIVFQLNIWKKKH